MDLKRRPKEAGLGVGVRLDRRSIQTVPIADGLFANGEYKEANFYFDSIATTVAVFAVVGAVQHVFPQKRLLPRMNPRLKTTTTIYSKLEYFKIVLSKLVRFC